MSGCPLPCSSFDDQAWKVKNLRSNRPSCPQQRQACKRYGVDRPDFRLRVWQSRRESFDRELRIVNMSGSFARTRYKRLPHEQATICGFKSVPGKVGTAGRWGLISDPGKDPRSLDKSSGQCTASRSCRPGATAFANPPLPKLVFSLWQRNKQWTLKSKGNGPSRGQCRSGPANEPGRLVTAKTVTVGPSEVPVRHRAYVCACDQKAIHAAILAVCPQGRRREEVLRESVRYWLGYRGVTTKLQTAKAAHPMT